jgi:hypothetical protein
VSKISKEMTLRKKEYKQRQAQSQGQDQGQWEGSEEELNLKTEISESERTLRSLRVSSPHFPCPPLL